MRKFLMKVMAAIAVLVTFTATPAMAQATRTWVSGVGDDANPCSRTAPCKTFAGAISKTASGGEISVLDPGGYGAVTITKPITIRADGDLGSVVVSGTNAIIVNVANPAHRVVLQGLEFDGLNQATTPGVAGVRVLSGSQVFVIDCTIRGFTTGIDIATPDSAEVTVHNTSIVGSTQNGIAMSNVAGRSRAWVTSSLLANNAGGQIRVNGATNVLNISDTQFTGRVTSFLLENGGRVTSYGNNAFPDVPPTGYTKISTN